MKSAPPSPQRILVRSVNWLGDAVMTTPALLRLREKFPGAHIALLCPEKLKEMWLHHPGVDEAISFAPGESVFAIGKKLRAGKFDLALVLPNSPRSALEVFWGGIPRRTGGASPWRNWLLTDVVPARPGAVKMVKRTPRDVRELISNSSKRFNPTIVNLAAHHIHQYLHLTGALGANPEPLAPQLAVSPEEIETVRNRFGLDKIIQPVFGLNPGAEYGPAKRWPAEKFIAAAREIQKQVDCFWLIFGGKADMELVSRIASEIQQPSSVIRQLNLAGKTSLRELMALLKCCRVLLTNDTGPMHVAAALGTPVVVPFGSTSPDLTGPGLPGDARHRLLNSIVPCSPCFLRECPIDFRCMNGITTEQAVAAVLEVAA